MPRLLLDTSVLIDPTPLEGTLAISVISLAELHFGVLVAGTYDERAQRARRLGLIESRFPAPLPVDDLIARELGRLQALVKERGGVPRARHADLILAATASVHQVPLLTRNVKDFRLVADQIRVLEPA
jgi:predicted nucleic acid-binding protein